MFGAKFVQFYNIKYDTETLHRIDCGMAQRSLQSTEGVTIPKLFSEWEAVPIFNRLWVKKHSCLKGYAVIKRDGALILGKPTPEGQEEER